MQSASNPAAVRIFGVFPPERRKIEEHALPDWKRKHAGLNRKPREG